MKTKLEIEANLHRSLSNQVKAPRLDRRFDAAVWARIEAAGQGATPPVVDTVRPSSARWMLAINAIGIAIAAVLVVAFGFQSFNEVSVSVTLPTPEMSAATADHIRQIAVQAVTIVSVVFGLMFTPLGRRLRAELT
jgi:hypothetical protein